jgi:hypothetical protein
MVQESLKKFKETLTECGFKSSRVDPCPFIRSQDGCKKIYLIIYIENGGIFIDEEDIKPIITALSKVFVVKDLGPIDAFFGSLKIKRNMQFRSISPNLSRI